MANLLSKLVKVLPGVEIPLSSTKLTSVNRSAGPSKIQAVQHHKSITKDENIMSEWDSWPNGTIKWDFTWKEFESTGQLMSHWVAKVGGGDQRGDTSAEMWERGKSQLVIAWESYNVKIKTATMLFGPSQLARGLSNSWRRGVKFAVCHLPIKNVKFMLFYGNGLVEFIMSRMELMTTSALHGFYIYQRINIKNLCS